MNPVGGQRWGKIAVYSEMVKQATVYTWSIIDTLQLLKKQAYIELEKLNININQSNYHNMWGLPEEQTWSRESWTSLLSLVTDTWTLEWLGIEVPINCQLNALLNSILDLERNLCSCESLVVQHGHVGLAEIEACVKRCQDSINLQLWYTRIKLPVDQDPETLRVRKAFLCGATNSAGKKIVLEPQWDEELVSG